MSSLQLWIPHSEVFLFLTYYVFLESTEGVYIIKKGGQTKKVMMK